MKGWYFMKKTLLTLAIAAGLFAAPFATDIFTATAEAKPLPPRPAAREGLVPHQVRIDNELNSISERFGIDETTVEKYYNQGWGFKELRRAAFLAYASGKDMGAVLDLKTTNNWPRVEYKLGLTPNDIKTAHEKNDAEYLKTVLGIAESTSLPLLKQNFSLGDVAHAALMSKYTTSTPAQIAEMHNPPEANWDNVATQLDISYEEMQQVRAELEKLRP